MIVVQVLGFQCDSNSSHCNYVSSPFKGKKGSKNRMERKEKMKSLKEIN